MAELPDSLTEACVGGEMTLLVGREKSAAKAQWAVVWNDSSERAVALTTRRWLEPEWTSLDSAALGSPEDARCCGDQTTFRQWREHHPEVVMRVVHAGGSVHRTTASFVADGGSAIAPVTRVFCVGDGDLAVGSIAPEAAGEALCSEAGPEVHVWYWKRDAPAARYLGHHAVSGRCPRQMDAMTVTGRTLTVTFTSVRAKAEGRACDEVELDLLADRGPATSLEGRER